MLYNKNSTPITVSVRFPCSRQPKAAPLFYKTNNRPNIHLLSANAVFPLFMLPFRIKALLLRCKI